MANKWPDQEVIDLSMARGLYGRDNYIVKKTDIEKLIESWKARAAGYFETAELEDDAWKKRCATACAMNYSNCATELLKAIGKE